MTGYNGVLGYRTDPEVYKDSPTLSEDIQKAKEVADAFEAEGWEFASQLGTYSYGADIVGKV